MPTLKMNAENIVHATKRKKFYKSTILNSPVTRNDLQSGRKNSFIEQHQ